MVPVDGAARRRGRRRASVWLARDGRVEARTVRLGLRTLDAAEVLEGLAAGELVLLGPRAAAGQRVRAD